ncbi:Clathrin light chain [Phytophthora infestans]|uniref:Clathrin light chain n=1 Tax=Phytophthora infestans TaxID=4787 RepID=A0A833T0B0_PHYIN|nr:Clathrin light chain [Phytophthora infestans]KAF4139713.1 Clathrin light chain [Phytophthora infestans]
MSDPFGDSNPVEDDVPQEISDFAPPAGNSGDFYEVEPTDADTNGAYEEHTEQSFDQTMEESYQPMDFAPAPVDTPADFQAEIPPAPMEISAQIPVVEEDNELTKFMLEYDEKIALKAQEQEKVAIECKVKAEENMAQFLAERQRIKESKMQSNRVFEQATLEKMVADLKNENPWERVVTLVDLETSRKKKLDALNSNKKDPKKQDPKPVAVPAKKTPEDEEDVSRMRQLFVQLKASPLEQTRADAVAAN